MYDENPPVEDDDAPPHVGDPAEDEQHARDLADAGATAGMTITVPLDEWAGQYNRGYAAGYKDGFGQGRMTGTPDQFTYRAPTGGEAVTIVGSGFDHRATGTRFGEASVSAACDEGNHRSCGGCPCDCHPTAAEIAADLADGIDPEATDLPPYENTGAWPEPSIGDRPAFR